LTKTWKIYYGNGDTFSDKDGDPWESPKVDVQVIAVQDPEVGRRFMFRHSYYIYKDDGWLGVDDAASLVLHLLEDIGRIKAVRAGLIVSQEAFRAVMKTAKEDDYI